MKKGDLFKKDSKYFICTKSTKHIIKGALIQDGIITKEIISANKNDIVEQSCRALSVPLKLIKRLKSPYAHTYHNVLININKTSDNILLYGDVHVIKFFNKKEYVYVIRMLHTLALHTDKDTGKRMYSIKAIRKC